MLETQKEFMITVSCIILLILTTIFLFNRSILVLAARNIIKNKRRTFILLCVIVSGLAGLMLFFGFADDSLHGLREATISSGLGHIQVYQKGYRAAAMPDKINFNIPNYREIVGIFESDAELKKYVKGMAADLDMSGLIAGHGKSTVFVGKGVDTQNFKVMNAGDEITEGKPLEHTDVFVKPEQKELTNEFEEMFEGFPVPGQDGTEKKDAPKDNKPKQEIWKDSTIEKRAANAEAAMDDALLGDGLKNALNAKLGDALTLVVSTKSGALNALDINVRGVILGVETSYNDTIVKIPMQYAWKLMGREDVSKICILLHKTEFLDLAYRRVQELVKEKNLNLETSTWVEEARMYQKVSSLLHDIFGSISFIIVLVVTFSIANAMMMSVMERTREIGTLRALGNTKNEILRLFMTEGFVIGLMGGLLSMVVGIAISVFMNDVVGGIPMAPPPGTSKAFIAHFRVVNNPLIWCITFNLAVFAAFISSILPAKKASNMEIVESIRYV